MKTYTKRILTWLMVIAMLTGIILTDYRAPVFSRAEEATAAQGTADGSASSSTEAAEQTEPQTEGAQEQTSPAATTQGAETQAGEQGAANAPANLEEADVTKYVDIKLYNFGIAEKVSSDSYKIKDDGYIVKEGENQPEIEIKQGDNFLLRYKWAVSHENMKHIKEGKFFKIKLPDQAVLKSKDYLKGDIKSGDRKLGFFELSNGVITATFEGDFSHMNELRNGFIEIWAYAVSNGGGEQQLDIPKIQGEHAEAPFKITIKPKPNNPGGDGGTTGTPGEVVPKKFPEQTDWNKISKGGWQGDDMIAANVISYTVDANFDEYHKKFKEGQITKRENFIIYDLLPVGLESIAWKGNNVIIQAPVHFPALKEDGSLTGGLGLISWDSIRRLYDTRTGENSKIQFKEDFNKTETDTNCTTWDDFIKEFKKQPKYTIGTWKGRDKDGKARTGLAINLGDLPYDVKYTDLFSSGELERKIEGFKTKIPALYDRKTGKNYAINEKQAEKMKSFYLNEQVPACKVIFYAKVKDTSVTEYTNHIDAEWTESGKEEDSNADAYNRLYGGKAGVEYGEDRINVKIIKKWNKEEPNNLASIQLELLENGASMYPKKLITLEKTNQWKVKLTGLYKSIVAQGDIDYTVKEELAGYKPKSSIQKDESGNITITVVNTKLIDIPVTKTWKGLGAGKTSPDDVQEVTVQLFKEGSDTVVDTLNLNQAGGWKGEFKNILKYDDGGNEIKYTVKEVQVEGYTSKAIKNQDNSFTITNTKAKINIPVEKKWDGFKVGEGPADVAEVEVELFANGTATNKKLKLNKDNSWKDTFKDLEINENGIPIEYTVKEKPIEGWYLSEQTGDAEHGFTLTNKKNPLIEIEVTKKWLRKDGTTELPKNHKKIPASIKVQLVNMTDNKNVGNEQEITAEKDWKHTFKNLPKFNATGTEIKYAVKEIGAPEGFASTVGEVTGGKAVIQNILAENPVTIKINKVWKDENGANLADDLKTRVVMQILHRLADGTYKLDVPVIEMNKDKGWSYTSNPLPEVDENGNKINYQVQEIEVPEGYRATSDVSADGLTFTITNTKIPRKSIKIEKKWVDENNNPLAADYEKMPNEITVRLYANGVSYKTVTLKKDADWKGQFDNLLTVDPSGDPIRYDVEELGFVDGFVPYKKVDQAKDIITITNKKTEEIVQLNISKKWVDVNNNPITDSNRLPDHISFKLFANGVSKGKLYVSKASGWNYTSGPLAKLDNKGKVINYTIEEDYVGGYTSTISKGADGYTFTATNKENPTPPGNPFIPPFIPDEPVPTPPNIPTPPAPNVPIDELVIEDDEVVLAGNDEEDLDDPEITDEPEDEEITDDLPRSNKDVPKTADFFMSSFANPLAVSTVIMMGYGLKKLVAKKKKD